MIFMNQKNTFNIQNTLFPFIIFSNIKDVPKRNSILQKITQEDAPLKEAVAAV